MEQGAFAADLVAQRTASLDSRDAGLASELVLGVLRFRGQIDFLIELFSSRAPRKFDLEVLTALRLGVYQLRYLDRIPAHAAVASSVDLVKRARKRSAAGMVNAVLRKVHRDPVAWPDRATALSCPEWMLERWTAAFGAEAAEQIARAALETPARYIRVRPGESPPPEAAPTAVPGCYRVEAPISGGYQMDIGSQSIVPLLELAPGMTFLDVCAAPGNKTAQALETPLRAIACDASFHRLKTLLSLHVPLVNADARHALPFARSFDRILTDAPCSGTGTLAHNPEIKWRLTPQDIARHAERQRAILANALALAAPGGTLVYSTCSLEPEENEEVIAAAVASPLSYQTVRRMPGRDLGDGFFAAIIRAPAC